MPFVIDASIAGSWILPDERHPVASAALLRLTGDFSIVPSLWLFEVRSILINNERRGRLTEEQTSQALALFASLPIRLDHHVDGDQLIALARLHRLTVYDAAYLELAKREAAPIATLDKELRRAAEKEALLVVD